MTFAGSTVVHTIGGFIALAGAIVLGPRLGRKFKRDGGAPMLPHDLTIAVSGGLILWFGWYGFNPGSTLSAMDFDGIGRVAANTTLAACAAGLDCHDLRLLHDQEVGRGLHHQRLPRRTRGHHLPLLLGQSHRRRVARRCGRSARRSGSRTAGVAAHRRSHRRGSGPRDLRHLGNPVARPVRLRQVRCDRAIWVPTIPPHSRACSMVAARKCSLPKPLAAPASPLPPLAWPWSSCYAVNATGLLRSPRKASCTVWISTSTGSRRIPST